MNKYETLEDAILAAKWEAVGWQGGADVQYYNNEDDTFGYLIHHPRGSVAIIENEIEQDYFENPDFEVADTYAEEKFWEEYNEKLDDLYFSQLGINPNIEVANEILYNADTGDGQGGVCTPEEVAIDLVNYYFKSIFEQFFPKSIGQVRTFALEDTVELDIFGLLEDFEARVHSGCEEDNWVEFYKARLVD